MGLLAELSVVLSLDTTTDFLASSLGIALGMALLKGGGHLARGEAGVGAALVLISKLILMVDFLDALSLSRWILVFRLIIVAHQTAGNVLSLPLMGCVGYIR